MTRSVVTEPLRPVELHALDRNALRQSQDEALPRVVRKLDKNIVAFGDRFPAGTGQSTASDRHTPCAL